MTEFANQDIAILEKLMGQALLRIQFLEEALIHSITLKIDVKSPYGKTKTEANNYLNNRRSGTFGKAITYAKKNNLYSEDLCRELEFLRDERNWLIHKLVPYNLDDLQNTLTRNQLFERIVAISNKATKLQQSIEIDTMNFSESVGVDMTRVRRMLEQHYYNT